jgi:hypothetical protein
MAMLSFFAELKDWQPVLGSVFGFGALTWGALYNYRLGRKRDDAIREKEALSVALGLYSEINLISNELASLANSIGGWYVRNGISGNDLPTHFAGNFVLPDPTLFKALSAKIGMLSPEILKPITRFYAYYSEAIGHFPKILENNESGISYGVEWVLDPAISAIEEVQPALREIERIGGIAEQTLTPCLLKAKKAKEMSDEMRHINHD